MKSGGIRTNVDRTVVEQSNGIHYTGLFATWLPKQHSPLNHPRSAEYNSWSRLVTMFDRADVVQLHELRPYVGSNPAKVENCSQPDQVYVCQNIQTKLPGLIIMEPGRKWRKWFSSLTELIYVCLSCSCDSGVVFWPSEIWLSHWCKSSQISKSLLLKFLWVIYVRHGSNILGHISSYLIEHSRHRIHSLFPDPLNVLH